LLYEAWGWPTFLYLKKTLTVKNGTWVSLPPKPLLKIKKERNWQEIVILKMAFGVCHGL
jgi:hypothetical protein